MDVIETWRLSEQNMRYETEPGIATFSIELVNMTAENKSLTFAVVILFNLSFFVLRQSLAVFVVLWVKRPQHGMQLARLELRMMTVKVITGTAHSQ